jgi:hypothetical protein
MASLMSRISEFARGPQGRRLMERATTMSRDPRTRRRIEQVRARMARRR